MEEILFCKVLPKFTSGQRFSHMFLEVMQDMNIDWAHISNLYEKALIPTYRVVLCAAKAEKPHTLAKSLILPATFDIAEVMFGKL